MSSKGIGSSVTGSMSDGLGTEQRHSCRRLRCRTAVPSGPADVIGDKRVAAPRGKLPACRPLAKDSRSLGEFGALGVLP